MVTKIAIVGLGGAGKQYYDCLAELEDAEVIAGVDPKATARRAFSADNVVSLYPDVETLLDAHANELEGVIVASPHALHYRHARAALESELHVLVEKPMTVGLERGRELVDVANEMGVTLQVGYQRHFHPGFREMKGKIERGEIGEIRMFSCYIGQAWFDLNEGKWRMNPELSGGGQLFDTGSHLLETLFWVTGMTPTAVGAVVDRRGGDVDVNVAMTVKGRRNDRRIIGNISVCGDSTILYPDEDLTIWGTEGRIKYDKDGQRPQERERLQLVRGREEARITAFDSGTDWAWLTMQKSRNFVDSIQTGQEPAVTGRFALPLIGFREAARRAWQTGEWVKV